MVGFATYAALLPELRDLWALSNAEAGMIASAFFGGYVATVSYWTALTDRTDGRRVYFTGCLLAAAGAAGAGGGTGLPSRRSTAGLSTCGESSPTIAFWQ